MPSGFVAVFGGQFTDASGQPYAGASLYARPSAETVAAGQISAQEVLLGILDNSGNLPQSANAHLWASDSLTPQGTVYALRILAEDGSQVWGPVNFFLQGQSPVNLSVFEPTTMSVSYPSPIVQNPTGDQTIQTNDLLPAEGNTTQSLGHSDAPWNGVFNNLTVDGSVTFNVVNALVGFQVNGAAPSGDVLRGNGSDFIAAQLAASDLSNGVTGTGAVVLANGPSFTGKFVKYNNIVLQGGGVPSIVYQSLSTGLTANFNAGAALTLYTPTTPAQFRVVFSQAITHAATSASVMPSLTLAWTDAAGVSRTKTIVATSSANTTSTETDGVAVIYTNGSTPIQVTSASYSSTGSVSMTYDLSLSLEAL